MTFPQIWDVLSNKEVVDIVASAPARASVARYLVESAVRAWRCKYPTSKIDDCAVVCLFFDTNSACTASNSKLNDQLTSVDQVESCSEKEDPSGPATLDRSGTVRNGNEIPQEGSSEDASREEEMHTDVGKDWSALEGVSRVNTLLNLPRFVPGKEDKAWK